MDVSIYYIIMKCRIVDWGEGVRLGGQQGLIRNLSHLKLKYLLHFCVPLLNGCEFEYCL